MRVDRRFLLLAALLLAVGVAVYLRGSPQEDSPEHRTDSDGRNGASAMRQLAQALGHPTVTFEDGFRPDLGSRVVFVLSPTTGFTAGEARQLVDYATGGGVVVYAAENGDPRLDATLHVLRVPTLASGEGRGAGPMLSGVGRVSGAAAVQPLSPGASQVVVLRGSHGEPIAFEERLGQGRVVVLSDPLPLCNGYLDRADNALLASDLVSLAGGGGQVAFDEYHHGMRGPESPLTGWLTTAWSTALTYAVLVVFVGLLLRGRAFGPRLELPGGGDRSSAEHLVAVGRLLRRSRAGSVTAQVLRGAARRELSARHGIAGTGPAFDGTLRQRAPAEASELEAVEAELARAEGREEALLVAARRLHELVHGRHR